MEFTEQHELDILKACACDPKYLGRAINLLKQHLFLSKAHGWLFSTMAKQFKEFNESPTELFAKSETASIRDEVTKKQYLEVIGVVFIGKPSGQTSSLKVLEDFTRYRVIQSSITDALDHLDKGSIDGAFKDLSQVITKGRINQSNEIDWIDEFEQRQAIRKQKSTDKTETCVPTRIRALDNIIDGLRFGEEGLIVGDTGMGKSIFLNHLGFMGAVSGYNVVHFSLEMPAIQVATRYDSRLLKIPHRRLKKYDLNPIEEQFIHHTLERRRKELQNRVYIASFPVRSCNVMDLREVLKRRVGEGHRPDLILVDSGDHMNPVKSQSNIRVDTSTVYWELKALSADEELGAPLWSTTQTKQEVRAGLIGLKSVSESYDKPRIADVVLTLNQTEEQVVMIPPEMDLWLAKHRDGEGKKKITLKAAFNIMMYQEVRELEIKG